MKRLIYLFLIILAVFILSACEDEKFTGETIDITFNTQIYDGKDEKGENKYKNTVVTEKVLKNPTRIAVYDLSALDTLDYIGLDKLGITDLALPKNNLTGKLTKYNNRKYTNVGTLFDLDEEELIKFNPQVVFIGGRSLRNYSRIKEILPHSSVVGFDLPQDQFFKTVCENLDKLGKIFDKHQEEFTNLKQQIITTLVNIKSKVQNDKKVLFVSVSSRTFSVYANQGRFSVVFDEEYGFGFPGVLDSEDLINKVHGEIVNIEFIKEMNPDILFVLDSDSARGNTSTLQETLATLDKEITAVKDNKILLIDPFAWYIMPGGMDSVLTMFNDILQLFE